MSEWIGGGETWYGRVDVYFSDAEDASMGEIKPALTAEGWAGQSYFRSTPIFGGGDPLVIGEKDWVYDGEDEYPIGCEFEFSGPDRHALAALALHGQPFGFTWEDVGALREWAIPLAEEEDRGKPSEATERLRGLADRIAALLPPREEGK